MMNPVTVLQEKDGKRPRVECRYQCQVCENKGDVVGMCPHMMYIGDLDNHIRDGTVVLFKLEHESAKLPKRGTAGSAGLDLFSVEEGILKPGETLSFSTGISMCMAHGSYGLIAPRSSLALNHSLTVMGGIIDSDYRGIVKVLLHNLGKEEFKVTCGMKIAQLIIGNVMMSDPLSVESFGSYEKTSRGGDGFGSTGY